MINKTKIVATLGPASSDKSTMLEMIQSGVNVFRINFSHGDHATHIETIKRIKELNDEHHFATAVLADLQGPKLRIGQVEPGTVITQGNSLIISTSDRSIGNDKHVYMNYEKFPEDVNVGERILLDDGKLILKVTETNKKDQVVAEVIQGGALNSNKGVNLPNTNISQPCLTPKDLEDLQVALDAGAEWIGLSFVRHASDVAQLKSIIEEGGYTAKVISKIEKPEAVNEIEDILDVTDAIMVARGDLGVEVPMQSVPLIQKMIVDKCHLAAIPVIIATQMMETMIDSLTPTRAEVNDVANSVLDGADAVMLSGETSVGKYPVQVVQAMTKIISHIEETADIKVKYENPPTVRNHRYITDSICYNAAKIADQVGAMAILTMTHSGYTAFKISSHRPRTNIVVFTSNKSILNMLSLIWGVKGFYYDKMESTDNTFNDIKEMIKTQKIASSGDLLVKVASMPIQERGTTNMLKISELD